MKRLPITTLLIVALLLFLQACADDATPTPRATPTAPPENESVDPMPVEDFVRQNFISGVPYEETLTSYDADDVPVLLDMLNNPDEAAHWANIVIVLNIIAKEDVAETIIDFINTPVDGTLSRPHFAAKSSAILSLGYLINRTGSETALNYLIESLDPAVWRERGVTGIGPFQSSQTETNQEMSKQALLGLALSGSDRAAEALRTFQNADLEGQQAQFQANVMELIPEALATNEEIANVGLVTYYNNLR